MQAKPYAQNYKSDNPGLAVEQDARDVGVMTGLIRS